VVLLDPGQLNPSSTRRRIKAGTPTSGKMYQRGGLHRSNSVNVQDNFEQHINPEVRHFYKKNDIKTRHYISE